MKKLLNWFENNLFVVATGFLLFFIPLWPKIPLVDIMHTWVYIRVEDFVVLAVLLLWIIFMLFKKVNFKTPLTLPIIIFWIIGAISTIHSILLIIPSLSNIYPNLALLNYLRRIEYMSLFFVAYSAMKEKKLIPYIVIILIITFLIIFGYGLGQKFFGLPAYLTMNEEFAKGLGVRLSSQSRISSTFAGHYDLAAYLVLILPIFASLIFGFKNKLIKLFLAIIIGCGFVLLFMTVSRISFFVLLLSFILVLLFQKKKKIIFFSLAAVGVMALFLLIFSPSLWQRFGNTVKEVDVLLDAQTGEELGHLKEIQTKSLGEKIIKVVPFQNKGSIALEIQKEMTQVKVATTAGLMPASLLPAAMPFLLEPSVSTGENLPQGTGYINLSLSPITKKPAGFLMANPKTKDKFDQSSISADFFDFQGDFLIKKALAYDLSFTTRFQGEWPKTIEAFKRNIFLGSGYSSVGLAVDNNYLRILGETGFLGFFAFFAIFITFFIYLKKTLPEINDSLEKSFVIGFSAGLFGLALNAFLIDVFEASKIAFLLWLLMGIVMGVLSSSQKGTINLSEEMKKFLTSTPVLILYLFIFILFLFSPVFNNFFVGDDFTWLRWAADNKNQSVISTIFGYFTNADGFFYRPGTKLYFLLMFKWFWLNQAVYYLVSVLLHFLIAVLFFLISKKILKNLWLSVLAVFFFVILSGYHEAVFWISATGHLFNAVFILLGLFCFMLWEEKKKNIFLWLSVFSIILSFLFHELGVVAAFIVILYRFCFKEKFSFNRFFGDRINQFLLFPILPYLGLRLLAKSHWFNGDYSYSLLKLPFNLIGNALGYLTLDMLGPFSLPFYQKLRDFAKGHLFLGLLFSIVLVYVLVLAYQKIIKKLAENERQAVIFGLGFFIIALLPFLGLGNIASRYSYLSSMGIVLVLTIFIKKVYEFSLAINGWKNTLAIMIMAIGIFSLWHLVQLQKVQGDWFASSERVRRFLISVDSFYTDSRTKKAFKLYLVNVPIRYGDAWIFPSGLNDVLWFVFHNQNLSVFQLSSAADAPRVKSISFDQEALRFDQGGNLVEIK